MANVPAVVKNYMGVDITVNEKGKFSARLASGAHKESSQLKVIEGFIASAVPKGRITLMRTPLYPGEGEKVVITGLAPHEGRKTLYSNDQPRLVTDQKGWRGDIYTIPLYGLVWPDDDLKRQLDQLDVEHKRVEKEYDETRKLILDKFIAPTMPEVIAALEASNEVKSEE